MEGSNIIEEVVVIVGAGPAGIGVAACLNTLSIPNIVLEREDCIASLWKKHSYDRLKLHLAKQFCALPHMQFPYDAPTFVNKKGFINYLDTYISRFKIDPRYQRCVELAEYDEASCKWHVLARNLLSGDTEEYESKFLVVATGENSEGYIPKVPGLETFGGEVLHSSQYKNGDFYTDKDVLVIGSGNSGMEIAFDLSNYEARVSLVIRSPVHVLSKEVVYLGMVLLTEGFPVDVVDPIVVNLNTMQQGDVTKIVQKPKEGPFTLKVITGRSPTIDVGTIRKIKKGEIKVFPGMSNIKGNQVTFENGEAYEFDAIIFGTGYRSRARDWLKGGDDLFGQNGMPKEPFPNHWKGGSGLYDVGFAQRGLQGIAADAKNIAADINSVLKA